MQLTGSDFRLLRVFDAVVRNGGFSAAQAELNISQPTISNHISSLEKRLGMTLCQRGRSGFVLTEKGKIVYELTQILLGSMAQFSEEINATKGHLVGELNVGMLGSVVTDPNFKLAQAVEKFHSRQNDVVLRLLEYTPQVLQEKLFDGKLHLAIGSFRHKISGLSYKHLYEEQQYLYCSDRHSLFNIPDSELTKKQILSQTIVGRGYWREYIEKKFGFYDIRGDVQEIEPQLILILSGKYIGFLPAHYVEGFNWQDKLRVVQRDKFNYTCAFDLIVRSGYRRTLLVETFINDLLSLHTQ